VAVEEAALFGLREVELSESLQNRFVRMRVKDQDVGFGAIDYDVLDI
jgi:hypothetical protein